MSDSCHYHLIRTSTQVHNKGVRLCEIVITLDCSAVARTECKETL